MKILIRSPKRNPETMTIKILMPVIRIMSEMTLRTLPRVLLVPSFTIAREGDLTACQNCDMHS